MRGSYSEEEARPAVVRQNLANKRLVPCDPQIKDGGAVRQSQPGLRLGIKSALRAGVGVSRGPRLRTR